jgi:LysM repeat protein
MESQIIDYLLKIVNARRKTLLTKEKIVEWISDPSKDPKNKVKKISDKPKKVVVTKSDMLDYVEEKYQLNMETIKKEILESMPKN